MAWKKTAKRDDALEIGRQCKFFNSLLPLRGRALSCRDSDHDQPWMGCTPPWTQGLLMHMTALTA